MSIFKNILFLQGLTEPRDADALDGTSYAQGYGNRIASEKALGRLGHGHTNEGSATAQADELCTAGGCG